MPTANDALVRLALDNSVFQEHLLHLQQPDRHAALDTLKKIRQLTWAQLYRENVLKWEKIVLAAEQIRVNMAAKKRSSAWL